MYNLKHLMGVAVAGVRDMRPALVRAFNANPHDDSLDRVFGPQPRRRIVALILGAIAAAELFLLVVPDFELKYELNWAAIVIVLAYAIVLRRYLFVSNEATAADFPWLAASIIPAAMVLTSLSFIRNVAAGALLPDVGAPLFTVVGKLLVAIADAYGVAAALTIALAALCFSRRWWLAVRDLAVNLALFKLLLWITVLVVIEIGIVGRILAAVIYAIFGIRFPGWLADFADAIAYAVLLVTVYTALIGATWVVCRQEFATLLATGDVRVVAAVRAMASTPKKPKQKKAPKKKKKRRWFGRKTTEEPADQDA